MNELHLFAGAGIPHHATMFDVDIFICQRKMCAWTKNTDTAKSENVPSAAIHSSHETRGASSNAARTHVVASFKQGRRHATVLSAEKNFCRLDRATKRAHAHAERPFVCHEGSLTQWSRFGTGLPCFAALSLQDACETRPTELHRLSGIRSRNYGRILSRTSRLACHGATTGKVVTNGA